jgi:hypothetical protein
MSAASLTAVTETRARVFGVVVLLRRRGVCGIRKREQNREGVSAGTFERNNTESHADAPSGNPRSSCARRCYPTTPPRHLRLRLYRSILYQPLEGSCQ